jgi:Holliday junction resolvase RusA-like endonuclease
VKRSITVRVSIEKPTPQPRQRSGRGGRPWLDDKDPIHAYKARIRSALERVWRGRPLLEIPVEVALVFVFPRLKAHQKKPLRSPFVGRGGDGDNLEKAVWDAMTGTVIADDRQIWCWSGQKLHADPGGEPTLEIRLVWNES